MRISTINPINLNINKSNVHSTNRNLQFDNSRFQAVPSSTLLAMVECNNISFGKKSPTDLICERVYDSTRDGKYSDFKKEMEQNGIKQEWLYKKGFKKKYTYLNPEAGIKVIGYKYLDGSLTLKSFLPNSYIYENFDRKGNITYLAESKSSSKEDKANRISVTYEYGKNARKIVRRFKDGELADIRVIDPKTEKEVTSGPLVKNTYKNEQGWDVTENILTGELFEAKLFNAFGKKIGHLKFSPTTQKVTYDYQVKGLNQHSIEKKYTDDGDHLLSVTYRDSSDTVTSLYEYFPKSSSLVHKMKANTYTGDVEDIRYYENGVIKRYSYTTNTRTDTNLISECDHYTYSNDGKMTSHTVFTYHDGQLFRKLMYVPGTDIKETQITYFDYGRQFERFNTKPSYELYNVPTKIELYERTTNDLIYEDFLNEFLYPVKKIVYGKYSHYNNFSIYEFNQKGFLETVTEYAKDPNHPDPNDKEGIPDGLPKHGIKRAYNYNISGRKQKPYCKKIFDDNGKVISEQTLKAAFEVPTWALPPAFW